MIKGLQPSLAEAGKIKIGGLGKEMTSKRGNKFRAPQKFDSFVVTSTHRDKDGNLMPDRALMEALPKGPEGRVKELPIILHSDDIDSVFPTAYAYYAGKKLLCCGDGETARQWNDSRTKQTDVPCPCPKLAAKECKPQGTLHCSIALPGHAVAGAVYKWRTTSIISINRMIGSLQQILATVGVLRGIPLTLKVEPITVSPGGKSTTVYCCHIELRASDISEVQRDVIAAKEMRKAIGAGDNEAEYKKLVSAVMEESEQEQAETQQEFDPENSAAKSAEITERLKQSSGLFDK